MSGYQTGLTGINAAQMGLNVIGNNIANAATEGYHRQEVGLRPAKEVYTNGARIGQGVEMEGISRLVSQLLENQLISQKSTLSGLARSLDGLHTMESAFGELTTSAISTSLDNFFDSLKQLSTNPLDVNLQGLVTAGAESLTNQLRNLGSIVSGLEEQTVVEARETVGQINLLASQIADLNGVIYSSSNVGNETSNILDQRDNLITRLAELVDVQVIGREKGVVDIIVGDNPLVLGSRVSRLESGLVPNGDEYDLGIALEGGAAFNTDVSGGTLGGLFSLRNEIIRSVSNRLDTLAAGIINALNRVHVQGVGAEGSFSSLTGWTVSDSRLSQMGGQVAGGTIYVRVTAPDGTSRRCRIDIDAGQNGDTTESIAAKFAAIEGLEETCLNGGKLQIKASTGYKFDFLPGVMDQPSSYTPNPLAGAGTDPDQAAPKISISGAYSGNQNQVYTCTVKVAGASGAAATGSGTIEIEVRNGLGNIVATINTGSGYVAGTAVEIENGIKVSFGSNGPSPGYFNNGDVFTIDALADSDTSGFLAAAGINCFFSGSDASSIALCDRIKQSGSRIAFSRTKDMTDNDNIRLMAQTGDAAMEKLGNLTPKQFYRETATDIGNRISMFTMQYDNTEGIIRNLQNQRDSVSGVDINEEATKMLVFEQMFKSMAKYINTVSGTIDAVMSLIR